jgi:uncharacterized protein (DUF58 family)
MTLPDWLALPLAAWRRRLGPRVHVRPTRTGLAYIVLVLGVLVAAVNTGNNLLYLVLSAMLALLVLSNLLAELNLRGLEVRRSLPVEVFAGHPAPGAFELHNLRRRFPAVTVHIDELDGGGARGLVLLLPPGEQAPAPVHWLLPRRGMARLGAVRLWSEFPFGLVRRWIDQPLAEQVLVYPAPAEGRGALPGLGLGTTREDPRRRGREGDFQSLRPYQPGDPIRDLHWPTAARTGKAMVVQRGAEAAPQVLIRVEEARGERWERALSIAAGEVERHARRGDAVGILLGGSRLEPRTGEAWRRRLLTELALAERRG